MKNLKIAKEISLPLDIVTQTIAILAKRRAGKSYTMRRITEQLLEASQQVVLVDPKGDQWGLRSSADGKAPGYPVLILGGEHGDLPLETTAGETIAKLVVEERVSVLLDLSQFRKHEVATFMTAFMENLYRLKAKEEYRTPVMLVVDEADAIAPQKPQKGEERMLGAIEDIVRRGGQRGLGCILVSQRSAVLNKNVLTQAQMLVVLRTIAPQDLAAMKAWIEVHGTIEEGKELMDSLPSLPIGDAWFWSPGWPTEAGIFTRAHVLPITTFDSGATPKPGERKIVPKNMADVDLEALKKQMASTIEKAKKDDPKELRKEIADLTRRLLQKNGENVIKELANPKSIEKAVDVAVAKRDAEWKAQLEAANKQIQGLGKKLAHVAQIVGSEAPINLPKFEAPKKTERTVGVDIATKGTDKTVIAQGIHSESNASIERIDTITGPEQRILDALAWMESIGIEQPEQTAVAFLAGYTYGGGGFNNPRGSLRTKGLVQYVGNKLELTHEGRQVAHIPDIPLTTEELHQKVLANLPGPEQRLLKPLLENGGEPVSGSELANVAGYTFGSGGFNNPRGRLRSLGLIEYLPGGMLKARDILFI